MDENLLEVWAEMVEHELQNNRNKSSDVQALSEWEPLRESIRLAKCGPIKEPRPLPNLGHWFFETGIQRFATLADALAGFNILLRGRPLPTEK
ncbi:MAG: hypothetical protein KDH20_17360 [Rhodocyclaceae bacterium]|nr:hypothetical protein [Rhodocyclaceae bacterium]